MLPRGGEDAELVPAGPGDVLWIVDLEGQPATAPWILPWSAALHRGALADPDMAVRLVLRDGKRVGFVILAGLQNPHRSVELRRLVVAPPARGRGIGRAALRAVRRLAFDGLRAHRLWLDVKTDNARARALYASEGFRHEGTLRECLREAGGWSSLAVMAVLEHDDERTGGAT